MLEDRNDFDRDVAFSTRLSDDDKGLLMDMNGELSVKIAKDIYRDVVIELDHYSEMCARIFVSLKSEVERHGEAE